MSRWVVIAGGGTGGHIFPGLAVADELRARGYQVHWLGAQRGLETELVPDRGLPLTALAISGIHALRPAEAARALGQLPAAVWAATRLVLRLQPVAVLGVGGYASAAGVMAAGACGVPWIIQEQNSVPGWTNASLAPWSDLICCGFADAVHHFPSLNAEWTGNPVRGRFFSVGDVNPAERVRLLVLGGSQGSLFLNQYVPHAVAQLRSAGVEVQVVHQTGRRWAEMVTTAYADLALDAAVEPFLGEPWAALADADLVISRSGALTVSELAAAGRGALMVPFAAAAGNHQEFNARALERAGGADVLLESQVTPDRLADRLLSLVTEPERLVTMGRAARATAKKGAAGCIADRLLSVGGVA
jgi:UDP-N-acetylglucosamine--N-acetylmuramyl-(pentapeptide) pyrophosphoryl-undecaprenol N-acetylglucosamine transferase